MYEVGQYRRDHAGASPGRSAGISRLPRGLRVKGGRAGGVVGASASRSVRYAGGMTMGRRRLMLTFGPALLVGGWGATWTFYNPPDRIIGVAGVVSMAVGAGLIGFAILRPTNRNDGGIKMSDTDQTQENPDDRVATIEIDCAGCGTVLRSPFKFHCRGGFDTGTLIGNKLQCSSCGEMTACNKENMRVVYLDDEGDVSGGFVGYDVPPRDGGQ